MFLQRLFLGLVQHFFLDVDTKVLRICSKINEEDFFQSMDIKTIQMINNSNCDVMVSYKSDDEKNEWEHECKRTIVISKLYIYRNSDYLDGDLQTVFVPEVFFLKDIIKHLETNNFTIVPLHYVKHNYFLSRYQTENELVDVLYNISLPLFVYRNKDTNACHTLCNNVSFANAYFIANIILVIFLFLLLLTFLCQNIPFSANELDSGFLWFTLENGFPLTKSPNLTFKESKKISKLIKLSVQTNKNQHSVSNIRKENDAIVVERINVYPIGRSLLVIIKWSESYIKDISGIVTTFYDGYITVENQNIETKPEINVNYNSLQSIVVNFDLDSKPVSLNIKKKNTRTFLIEETALALTHIYGVLYSVRSKIFSDTIDKLTVEKYVDEVYERLDYSAICIYRSDGQNLSLLVGKIRDDDKCKQINNFASDYYATFGHENEVTRYIGDSKYIIWKFSIVYTDYIMFLSSDGFKSSIDIIDCSIKHLFMYLLTYFHNVQGEYGSNTLFGNIDSNFSSDPKRCHIACKSSPKKYYGGSGFLFGEYISAENVHLFFSMLPKEIDEAINSDTLSSGKLIYFHLHHKSIGLIYYSLRFTNFYSSDGRTMTYIYIISDVTEYFSQYLKLKLEKSETFEFTSMLDMHKLTENLEIIDEKELSNELYYENQTKSFVDLLHDDEKDINKILSDLDTQGFTFVRLVSSMNNHIWYTIIKCCSCNYIYSSCENKTFIIYNDISQRFRDLEISDLNLVASRTDSGDIIRYIAHNQEQIIINLNLKFFIDHVTRLSVPEDSQVTIDHFNLINSGNPRFIVFNASLARKGIKKLYTCISTVNYANITYIFLFKSSDSVHLSLNVENINLLMEKYLRTSKFLIWCFEDSKYPERIYSKELVGNIYLNWSTITKYVPQMYRDEVVSSIQSGFNHGYINVIIPISINNTSYYLFRGHLVNNTLHGLAINITDVFGETIASS